MNNATNNGTIEKLREKFIGLFGNAAYENDITIEPVACSRLIDYLIANGATVQEWIPVSEPPKERGRYLCYFKYEPESPDVICENTYYGSGHWMSETDRVTHWSYLLKPPKGGLQCQKET